MSQLNSRSQRWMLIVLLNALWLLPPFFARIIGGSWKSAADIGQAFGGASSLFSGLALLGVLYTLVAQRQEAGVREQQLRREQTMAHAQLLQLSLSTQLQSARTLIADHRKALVELSPAIADVPTSPSLLRDLRAQIDRDAVTNGVLRKRAPELLQRIDELIELHDEIASIRSRLSRLHDGDLSSPERPLADEGPCDVA